MVFSLHKNILSQKNNLFELNFRIITYGLIDTFILKISLDNFPLLHYHFYGKCLHNNIKHVG